jgi:ribonuclease D
MTHTLPPHDYIATTDALYALVDELRTAPLLAFDTESNSLHAYREQVCLIQLSSRERDYIIDPFPIDDMTPLGDLLADDAIEIVFHAAEYDLMTLKRDYGFTVTHLFDTLIAARLLGYESFGLAAMLKTFYNVKADKRHQRDNWGARPLSADSLQYAQMDTHFLPDMRDRLMAELQKADRWDEALELFAEAQEVNAADNSLDPDGYWNIGRPSQLPLPEMAILRELYLLREELAEAADVPTFKILTNKALVNITQAAPKNFRQLGAVHEVGKRAVRQYGHDVIAAIERGQSAPLPEPPPLPTPPEPDVAERFTVLQQWRKQRGIERNVASDLVLPKDALWSLAYELPTDLETLQQVTGMGPQRMRLYANDLLDVVASLRG